jgi:hypothetical protein
VLGEVAEIAADPRTLAALQAVEMGSVPPIGVARGIDQRQVLARIKQAGIQIEKLTVEAPTGAVVRRKSQVISRDAFEAAAIEAARPILGEHLPLEAKGPEHEFRAPMGELELVAESSTAQSGGAAVVVAVRVDGKRFNARTIRVTIGSAAEVRANTPITIVLRSGGAVVELQGKTRTSGYVGQSVAVRTQTGADLSATLTAPDRAEVKL